MKSRRRVEDADLKEGEADESVEGAVLKVRFEPGEGEGSRGVRGVRGRLGLAVTTGERSDVVMRFVVEERGLVRGELRRLLVWALVEMVRAYSLISRIPRVGRRGRSGKCIRGGFGGNIVAVCVESRM